MPDRAMPGVINYQGKVRVTSEQCVLLIQVGEHPGAITEPIAETRGTCSLVALQTAKKLA